MPSLADRLLPDVSDRYRIERELGAGGMANVYLASDLRHDRQVAIKVLRPDLTQGIGTERFLREIRIAAQLYHPHILGVIDSGESNGLLYYVMPYVDGESVRDRLSREGEFPVSHALRILRQVIDALGYAHQRGVVHRDIKPENLLLAGQHAFVADFGVAKALTAATERGAAITTSGVALGTPAYMAPEQAAADPGVDQRADIYAFGVVAYELLTGAPPFARGTTQQILAAHVTSLPTHITDVRPSVPTELGRIVMTCLEKRPADRWQTASELASRLEHVSETPDPTPSVRPAGRVELHEGSFRLSEEVCRKLNRATLNPRIIGDRMQYLENDVDSDILVVFAHGTGLDHRSFAEILAHLPYHGIAPTLYGFEAVGRRRIPMSLEDQVVLLREFITDAAKRLRPKLVILTGFSATADLGFRMIDVPAGEPPLPIDGFLALSPNLSLETCFVTKVLARAHPDNPELFLNDLSTFGAEQETLDDWLNVHEYLVNVVRKFHDDIGPLQRFAAEIMRPFEQPGETVFANWLRIASERVKCLRIIFEETGVTGKMAQQLRLKNLDSTLPGDWYKDESIEIDLGANHFQLMDPDRLLRHLSEMVTTLRPG